MELFWNTPKKIKKLQKTRKYYELFEFCSKTLEKSPRNLDAIRGKIFALQKLKRSKDAFAYCNKVLEEYPYDSDVIDCIVKMPQEHDFEEEAV